MNLSMKGFLNNNDAKLNSPKQFTALNPNAAEFVPSSLRTSSGNAKSFDVTRLDAPGTSGNAVLNRSESNISNSSDDEAHQFWRRQLPDDITPDFKVMGEHELQGTISLPLAGLSIGDEIKTSKFSPSVQSQSLDKRLDTSVSGCDVFNLSDKMRYAGLSYEEDQSSATFMNLAINPWNKQFMNGDQHLSNGIEEDSYDGDSSAGFLNDFLSDHTGLENATISAVDFLASQFPGFAAESLADIYSANGSDLNLTIEILTQLELQVDGGFNQNLNSKTYSAPSLSALDFPALPGPDAQNDVSKFNGSDLQHASSMYRSVDKESFPFLKPTLASRSTPNFASAVRRLASQDSGRWKVERNGSIGGNSGANRRLQISEASYNGKSVYADKSPISGAVRAAPVWLETGDAVANMYSDSREEARDLASLRNACFEQARQAYLIGNKALAKELSVKGQFYNTQMKAAHEKAREAIYRHRNPVAPEVQGYGRGHDPLIDLHGLHVSEAIHVLKHEMSTLRRTARSAGQRLQVMICVGTGHHTKGSRTPARLPVAVEQYLLEEGLQYTEPQPGLLRVLIY